MCSLLFAFSHCSSLARLLKCLQAKGEVEETRKCLLKQEEEMDSLQSLHQSQMSEIQNSNKQVLNDMENSHQNYISKVRKQHFLVRGVKQESSCYLAPQLKAERPLRVALPFALVIVIVGDNIPRHY